MIIVRATVLVGLLAAIIAFVFGLSVTHAFQLVLFDPRRQANNGWAVILAYCVLVSAYTCIVYTFYTIVSFAQKYYCLYRAKLHMVREHDRSGSTYLMSLSQVIFAYDCGVLSFVPTYELVLTFIFISTPLIFQFLDTFDHRTTPLPGI